MTSTQSKSNKNNLIRNAIFAILAFILVFILGLYIHASLDKLDIGDSYSMNRVELFKNVELTTTTNSVIYNFTAKKNSDNMTIILDFNKLSYTTNTLKELYKNTRIILYDKTKNELIYSGIINTNALDTLAHLSVRMYVPTPSSLDDKIKKNHQYIITIENLPYKTNVSGYDSFILVVGNVEKPWL